MTNETEPRPYTAEEELSMFMEHLRGLSSYWARQPDLSHKDRCDGLLHSVLATLDGVSNGMPGYDLHVSVHPDDEAFNKEEDENWHQIGLALPTDRMLHEALYDKKP